MIHNFVLVKTGGKGEREGMGGMMGVGGRAGTPRLITTRLFDALQAVVASLHISVALVAVINANAVLPEIHTIL